jgi:hypothetical protein
MSCSNSLQLFVPFNPAFADGGLPLNDELFMANLAKYHMVETRLSGSALLDARGSCVRTLAERMLCIEARLGSGGSASASAQEDDGESDVYLLDALGRRVRVLVSNIHGDLGVMHVVESVLLPAPLPASVRTISVSAASGRADAPSLYSWLVRWLPRALRSARLGARPELAVGAAKGPWG